MFKLVFLTLALTFLAASAIVVTEEKGRKGGFSGVKDLHKAISQCADEDKDCAFLAFNVYRHYNPDSQFAKDTLAVQDTMRGFIADCEESNDQCTSLKAYAFEKVFPSSETAKADLEKSPLDMNDASIKAMTSEIDTCLAENPLCTHLIISEFCNLDGAEPSTCKATADADEKFQALIKNCEGRMGKVCKKLGDKAACKFFPAACSSKQEKKLKKFAEKMAEKMAKRAKRGGDKKEVREFAKEIRKCEEEDKDCAFLAFKTYRHFFPESAFVKKVTEIEDSTLGQMAACEDEDAQCNALKAYAFSKMFPESEDAKADLAKWPLDLENEENKKQEAAITTCMSENPLCKHMVLAAFCALDEGADAACKDIAEQDAKFAGIIEKCEADLGKFCGKIAKKGACKFFQATCQE